MTEQEVVWMVQAAPAGPTDFSAPYWTDVDEAALQKCFGKGFLWWVAGRVIVTPLGKRSCGGDFYYSVPLGGNERFNR